MVQLVKHFSIGLFFLALISCTQDRNPNPVNGPTAVQVKNFQLFVVNSLSEDIFRFASKGNEKYSLGCQAPNDLRFHAGFAYVTCSLSQSVQVYRLSDWKLEETIFVGDNVNPWQLEIVSDKKAYLSSFMKDEVLVLDLSESAKGNRVVGHIDLKTLTLEKDSEPTLPRPSGMLHAANKLYVALGNMTAGFAAGGPGYVAVIDTATDKLQGAIRLQGRNTQTLVLHPLSSLLAISAGDYVYPQGFTGNGYVEWISPLTDSVTQSLPIQGSPQEGALVGNELLYLNNAKEAKALRVDLKNGKELPSLEMKNHRCGADASLPLSYLSAVASPNATTVYFTEFNSNCMVKFDVPSEKVTEEQKVGDGPEIIAILPE